MALTGPVPIPKVCLRENQKAISIPQKPINEFELSFNHALPMPDSEDAIPLFGLGTWQSKAGELKVVIRAAIEEGYRHFDCAQGYMNQGEVGKAINQAIEDGLVKREELWITTKVWNTFHSYEAATKSIDDTLKEMNLEYLDLVLIHWPMGYEEGGDIFPKTSDGKGMRFSDVDYTETWRALEVARMEGKTRHIGVSNFGIGQIMRLIKMGRPKPQVVQVEVHVYLSQKMMRDYCASEGIALIAYSPLANNSSPFRTPKDPSIFKEQTITDIAKAHNVTNAQIALRWILNYGIGVIPKSSKVERIKENGEALKVMLSGDDMKKLDKLNKDKRFVDLKKRDGHHPHFPW
uniref:NADP-dependent oxidoreductase domain-containing protein n=1 Tax=Panagrolaimus davidi TaxID=227884 RepID=A0A914PBC7_9BILA